MKRIDRYNEYLLEKEFESIIASILLVAEGQTGPNTFEWDLSPKKDFNIKDKKEFSIGDTVEFDLEQKKKLKDYLDFVKAKAKGFKGYISEKDPKALLDSISEEKMKELLEKMFEMAPSKEEAMKKAKEYFDRLVLELRALPYEIKRSIIKKFVYVFMVFIPLANLMPDFETKDSLLKDIKTEISTKKSRAGES